MRRYIATIMLGGALLAPLAMNAQDRERREQAHARRYYDPYKRDYHEWNDQESRAWQHWITEERHRKMHDWSRASKSEQRAYWRWRHEHADWDRH